MICEQIDMFLSVLVTLRETFSNILVVFVLVCPYSLYSTMFLHELLPFQVLITLWIFFVFPTLFSVFVQQYM